MEDQQVTIGMKPSRPGQFIKDEILDVLGITISKAAQILQVRRATLNDLVTGKSGLSADMAVRIEVAFGVNADMLSHMQMWYDLEEARKRVRGMDIIPYR